MDLRLVRRVTAVLLVGACLPVLSQCEPGEPGPCDFTSVAFSLPKQGEVLELRAFACSPANEPFGLTLWVEMNGASEYGGGIEFMVELAVEGDASAEVVVDGYAREPEATASAGPSTCSEGLTVRVTHVADLGQISGVVRLRGDVDDESIACDVRLEAP